MRRHGELIAVDEIVSNGRGRPPTRRALAIAVIANPYAGRYVEQLDELVAIGEELGGLLGARCVEALDRAGPGRELRQGRDRRRRASSSTRRRSFTQLGAPLRKAVEKGRRWSRRREDGRPGTAIDVPLGQDAAYAQPFRRNRARVPDAPRAGEIVVVVAVTDSGPLARIGGLQKHEIRARTACAERAAGAQGRGRGPRFGCVVETM